LGISSTHTLTFATPFRSGHVIDAVLHEEMSSSARDELRLCYQSLVEALIGLLIQRALILPQQFHY